MKDKHTLVIAGGVSSERDISLRSGKGCYTALQSKGYNVSFLDIKSVCDLIDSHTQKPIDYAFLCTHGSFGEDGKLQSILEWLQVPYTGSKVLASALCMNKYRTKQILNINNLPTAPYQLLSKAKDLSTKNMPFIIKLIESGSSYGVYKINSHDDLNTFYAENPTLNTDEWMVEDYIPGRELTISILEINKKLEILPILELKPKNDFYDLEAKYTKGLTEFILPAPLPSTITQTIKDISYKAFQALGCTGYGRVDIILDQNNNPHILEINTLPGMTETSDLPAQAQAISIPYPDLVEKMLQTVYT